MPLTSSALCEDSLTVVQSPKILFCHRQSQKFVLLEGQTVSRSESVVELNLRCNHCFGFAVAVCVLKRSCVGTNSVSFVELSEFI